MRNPIIFASVAALLAACASQPQRNGELEQARSTVETLSADPLAQQAAAHDLAQAHDNLRLADDAQSKHRPEVEVTHLAYLAQRHAEAGEARAQEARARQEVARSEQERNRVLLEARTREAQQAQSQAQSTQQQLQAAQQQLQDMQAKQTNRGMVLTLGDVLFDTNKATLKPGADQRLDRLAMYLQSNPNEKLIIEGYTDSTGSEEHNQELSQRRAQSVADALATRGVPASRYSVVGRGESFPVASNSTEAGRQQNRRVEVVFSDQSGRFAEGPPATPTGAAR